MKSETTFINHGTHAHQSGAFSRNSALDFTKGILVLLMILYHWFNYFVSPEGIAYVYLRFITPSFIFLAGFLIGNTYPSKYGWGSRKATSRLFERGVKIVVIFTSLNLAANGLVSSTFKGEMPGLGRFLRDAVWIYGPGSAGAAFEVLLPIGYLLIFAAMAFLIHRQSDTLVRLSCGVVFGLIGMLHYYGFSSTNLELVSVGLLGMVVGLFPIERINSWVNHPYGLLLLYACYTLAITVWNVRYGLQIIGVCLNLMLIYLVGLRLGSPSWTQNKIEILGQYSLFGYIAQIGILQVLYKTLSIIQLGVVARWTISFASAVILTSVAVNTMHFARSKWPSINRIYSAAFS